MNTQQSLLLRWATIAIMVIAGAWTLFHIIWGFTGQTSADEWGYALLALFVLALILAFVQFFYGRSAIQSSSGEPFPEPALGKFFLASAGSAPMWFVVRMDVGAEWLLAGWEKIKEPAVWGTSGVAIKG